MASKRLRAKAPKAAVPSTTKRRINLTVDAGLVERARAVGLNFSQIAEAALIQRLREEDGRRWLEENREAIEHHRRRIERDGMWNRDLISF